MEKPKWMESLPQPLPLDLPVLQVPQKQLESPGEEATTTKKGPRKKRAPAKKKTTTKKVVTKPLLECNLCAASGAFKHPECTCCPANGRYHYSPLLGDGDASYFCISSSPGALRVPTGEIRNHPFWSSDEEKMVADALYRARIVVKEAVSFKVCKTYAVHCDKEAPGAAIIDHCSGVLKREILQKAIKGDKAIFVFALGTEVVKALGIPVKKIRDLQGKIIETQIEGRRVFVFVSMSLKQIISRSGYLEMLNQHTEAFFRAMVAYHVKGEDPSKNMALPLTQLAVNYVVPKTLEEVHSLVDYVINYTGGTSAESCPISIDTETNTLHPHKAKLKLLTIVFAWGDGLAASIPVEHDESPWTLDDVFTDVQALLACPKPKIFHHAKFDLRVLEAKGFKVTNLYWDTLIGEHLVSEDKTGYYGLKMLTTTHLPRYAGYEDELQQIHYKYLDNAQDEDNGYAHVPLKYLNLYGACDADVTRQLSWGQYKRMGKEDALIEAACKPWRNHDVVYIRKTYAKGSPYTHPLHNIMDNLALPLSRVLAHMESNGFPVDREYAQGLAVEMDEGIATATCQLLKFLPEGAYENFNYNSGPQLRQLLFSTGFVHPDTGDIVHYRDLPEEKLIRTDTGEISVNAAFLKYLKNSLKCPLASILLDYRSLHKARTTFIKNILAHSQEDGRMHTTFNITGTATGRLSSSNENMQNIPFQIKTSSKKYNVKKMFRPSDPENMVICNADAKAAEVRIYAAYSQDPNLVKALCDGMDPHSFFSSVVYKPSTVLIGVPAEMAEDVLATVGIDSLHDWSYEDFENRETIMLTDPEYGNRLENLRKNIKRVVFGILYGASKRKISSIVGIPDDQAQAIIDVLFRMFPTIPRYIETVKEQVRKLRVLETFTGRRRRFKLEGASRKMMARAERQGVNFKIQSTSSDIVMDTLCAIEPHIRAIGGKVLITVHDSIVFEVPKDNLHLVPALIQRFCVDRVAEKYPWLPVPFLWDVTAGPSYGEQSSIDGSLAVEGDDLDDVDTRNLLEEAV